MAITKYDQFDFLIDIVPRDEQEWGGVKKNFKTNLKRKGNKLQIIVPDQYQCFGSGLDPN
jgi:hypothetical protein